jgi:hypothetical protein
MPFGIDTTGLEAILSRVEYQLKLQTELLAKIEYNLNHS